MTRLEDTPCALAPICTGLRANMGRVKSPLRFAESTIPDALLPAMERRGPSEPRSALAAQGNPPCIAVLRSRVTLTVPWSASVSPSMKMSC